jgi:hypothetical protein
MQQQKAKGRRWFSILLVLILCIATYVYGSMGFAQAAYSPTASEQATQQAPWEDGHGSNRGLATHGGMTPAQSVNLTQEGDRIKLLPAQEHRLPNLYATADHAAMRLMYNRPLSELASRTGGHAPPIMIL